MKPFIILMAIGLSFISETAAAAGFQRGLAPDPDDKPIEIGIWYPSEAPAPNLPNSPFRQALAVDGPVIGESLPLVILSHGSGGWMGGHADTALALAEAGYVAVALTHTGNNFEDESSPPSRWMIDRPRHVSRAIDYMLTNWGEHERIDPSRIGIFGFSAGGYTALVSVGGRPNIERMITHCRKNPEELACKLGVVDDFKVAGTAKPRDSAWLYDRRIKAAVVVAPGIGFAFDVEALASVAVSMQLWAASEDRNVPFASNTAVVRQSLPTVPELHIVEGAGHFAFLPPCNPALEDAWPKVWAMVCVDPPGFDRLQFHDLFNREIVAFFDRALVLSAH